MRKLFLAGLAIAALVAPAVAATDQDDARPQRRTRITVYPQDRPTSVNSKRDCVAYLEKEYRPSGTVIVPRERCVWR
jgi:hypothetical protein